jgi:hypothetical protein
VAGWQEGPLRPGFNGVGTSVATNQAQWDGGLTCGKCVRTTGTDAGLGVTPTKGPTFATTDNLCPECKCGDTDLGLGGDGRWQVNWDFVPCGRRQSSSLRGGNGNGDLDWSKAEALVASPSQPPSRYRRGGVSVRGPYKAEAIRLLQSGRSRRGLPGARAQPVHGAVVCAG